MRILVVEDEKKLAHFIKKGLEEQKYIVDVAYDGIRGEELANTNDYDLVIMDILIPGQNGLQVCENLRRSDVNIPIIFLTALGNVTNRIQGLDRGADDYIAKPFEFAELLARVRAQLRRRYLANNPVLVAGNLKLDVHKRKAYIINKEIDLTNKEFSLLEYLVINKNKVVTRTMISEHVWDIHFDTGSNIIDVFVNYLRKKIESVEDKKIIQTIRGVGYIIQDDQNG